MRFHLRQALRDLSVAFGSRFIWNCNQLGAAARTNTKSSTQPYVSLTLRGPQFMMGSLEERKWKK